MDHRDLEKVEDSLFDYKRESFRDPKTAPKIRANLESMFLEIEGDDASKETLIQNMMML